MIIGVGVDLVEVARMRRAIGSPSGRRFIGRIFSPEEVAASDSAADPAQAYAARFAAKEALAKALGTGFSRGVTPARIRVRGGERERPRIEMDGPVLEIARSMGATAVHLSLTHSRETAAAFVVVEG